MKWKKIKKKNHSKKAEKTNNRAYEDTKFHHGTAQRTTFPPLSYKATTLEGLS